ncbi:hypothetical protein [Arthrobacter sp. ISL-28]|uniref:hypothetical protein n=1 Tax=Arthrobacter sp. ISL-28 TaxID=2819108 RepID=UPI001BEAB9B0|nr:hypothetical protein [Arthrobacter sp. ISL-28]MBT2520010.1 hypothetical protein [Arthrobacter sp. ISL-28]
MSRKCRLAPSGTGAAVLMLCLNLAACSQGPGGDSTPASNSPATAHLIVTSWRNGDDAMLAQNSGTLTKLSDGCVGLRALNDPKSKPVLLRWPAGTRLSEDGKAVVGSSSKRFAFDSVVGPGGGFGHVSVPSECDSSLWGGVYDVQEPL